MSVATSFEESFERVKDLAAQFKANEAAYLAPRYQEAEVRNDFLNPFFNALGWDVNLIPKVCSILLEAEVAVVTVTE